MTGWRMGYGVWPKALFAAAERLAINCHSCVNAATQWAGIAALEGPQDCVTAMVAEFDKRRHVVVEGLNRLPGTSCIMPKGAFYAFPNVSGLFGRRGKGGVLRGSADVCAFLLEEARIATVAGVDFGSDAHIRLSYATGLDTITEGLRRMDRAVRGLEG
jgi:aspartate/methionine/tyrosine aminotransferase